MRLSNSFPAILLAGTAFLLSACSSEFINTRPDDISDLAPDYGVVAVQVTNSRERLSPWLQSWTAAHVVSLDNPENKFLLSPAGSGLLGSQFFIGVLPPGRYRIYNLQSYRFEHGIEAEIEAPVPANLGTFRVEAGQLTSLGTVMTIRLGAVKIKNRVHLAHAFSRYAERENFKPFIKEATPELHAALGDRVHGWDVGLESLHRELSSVILDFIRATNFQWLGDGEIAATGPMGSVFVRRGRADWHRIDTGATQQITAITKTNRGYVIVGERGLVMQAETLDGEWRTFPGPGQQVAIKDVVSMENGRLYAFTSEPDRCAALLVSPDFLDWERVFDVPQGRYIEPGLCPLRSGRLPDDRIVIFGGKQRVVLDNQGQILERGESMIMHYFKNQPNGASIAHRHGAWAVDRLGYSFNGGETWNDPLDDWPNETDRPGAEGNLLVLPDGRSWRMSYKGYSHKLTKKVAYEEEPRLRLLGKDGKIQHWGEKVEPQCTQLLPQISTEERIFVQCHDGRLIVTEDGGESWTEDFVPGGDTQLEEAFDRSEFVI